MKVFKSNILPTVIKYKLQNDDPTVKVLSHFTSKANGDFVARMVTKFQLLNVENVLLVFYTSLLLR